jgi:ceramide glucosyltransferase
VAVPFLVLAGLGIVFYLLSCAATVRFCLRARRPAPASHPPVTVLKAFRGADRDLAANLETFARLDGGEAQVLFGCAEEGDPGHAVALDFCARHTDARIEVVREQPGANEKVNNLAGIVPLARHPLLLLADSDVRVEPDLARRTLAPFDDPKVGLVSCPYRARGLTTPFAALEAAWIGLEFIPSVFLAAMLGPVRFALGATIALRREALDAMGGFAAIRDHLADDFQLGARVAAAGWRVHLAPAFVDLWCGPMGLRDYLLRQVRWARTIRVCNPAGHLFSVLSRPIPFALLAAAVEPTSPWALGAVAATFGVRILTGVVNALAQGCEGTVVAVALLSPLLELLSTVVWLLAWGGRTVVWRGRRFELDDGGRLVRRGS